jgi:putative ABC transport system permease protein
MSRRVPLARRYLFGERRRAILATTGVAVALLLVLVLDGIFAGAMRQVTAYIRTSPADVIVSQHGVRTMHMTTSVLPTDTVDAARAVDGVAWAEPIGFVSGVIGAPTGGRQLSYIIGYTPGRPGGPHDLVAGRAPGAGEAVLDRVAADQLDLHLGDHVRVLGTWLTVSGLAEGGTSIVNTTTFVTAAELDRIHGPTTSYLLVGARPGTSSSALRDTLARALPDASVQTRNEFARQEAAVVADMSADVMRIMAIIGFAIALAVVSLTLFTGTLARLRDYGIIKALGASSGRLAGIVIAQAVWTVALAVASSVALALVVAGVVEAAVPTIAIAIEPSGVMRVAAGAAAIGAVSALAPLRRVIAVDPTSAFRRLS